MSSTTSMKIGELGRKTNVPPKTIRYYEERGLLPEPKRLDNGYRIYREDDVRRLQFIRGAQAAGLSLDAVSDLLVAADEGSSPCCLTRSLARKRIEEIDRQIGALERLRNRLSTLIDPAGTSPPEPSAGAICPLIGA